MHASSVKTIQDARNIVEERNLKHVKVGVFDLDGVLRGKYLSKEKFLAALDKGFGFCDVVLGWDVNDQLFDNVSFTGWHSGYPDAPVRLIPESCRELPLESSEGNKAIFFLGEFAEQAEAVCPRAVLKRVLSRAKDMGYDAFAGFEYEFFLFKETPQSVVEKSYQNLTSLAPGNFGYSVIRNSVEHGIYQTLLDLSEEMDFPIEGLHEETGPGVLEAAIAYDNALLSADKAGLFKTFCKIAAQKNDLIATFMAKWHKDYPGQSGHIHISLRDKADRGVFYDEKDTHGMSEVMKYFVAGQQKYMPELMAMVAPTINSYRRLIPGFWAPTIATAGVDNRTCALRVVPGSENSQRIEYRVSAADANPHLVLAAALASGLKGIEEKLELGELVSGNAYEQTFPPELHLPTTLWDSAQLLKSSEMAKDMFGDTFVQHFAASREWEEREFRKHISDWEMSRYFEII